MSKSRSDRRYTRGKRCDNESNFKRQAGPKRNAVLLNAGAGLYVAGKAGSIAEGVRMAEKIIDSGAAGNRLDEFIKLSNEKHGDV